MAGKKTAAATQPKRQTGWKCTECGSTFNVTQMELQPKTCTSCGEGDLEPTFEE
jgi:rubrerythrin